VIKHSKTDDPSVDKKMKLIHDTSELIQQKLWDQKHYHGAYVPIPWEDVKEGFYKAHLRSLVTTRRKKQ